MSNLWNFQVKDILGLGKGRARPGSAGRTDQYYGNMGSEGAQPSAKAKRRPLALTAMGGSPAPSMTGKLLGGGG